MGWLTAAIPLYVAARRFARGFGLIKWGFAVVIIALVLIGRVKAALNGFRKQA